MEGIQRWTEKRFPFHTAKSGSSWSSRGELASVFDDFSLDTDGLTAANAITLHVETERKGMRTSGKERPWRSIGVGLAALQNFILVHLWSIQHRLLCACSPQYSAHDSHILQKGMFRLFWHNAEKAKPVRQRPRHL